MLVEASLVTGCALNMSELLRTRASESIQKTLADLWMASSTINLPSHHGTSKMSKRLGWYEGRLMILIMPIHRYYNSESVSVESTHQSMPILALPYKRVNSNIIKSDLSPPTSANLRIKHLPLAQSAACLDQSALDWSTLHQCCAAKSCPLQSPRHQISEMYLQHHQDALQTSQTIRMAW